LYIISVATSKTLTLSTSNVNCNGVTVGAGAALAGAGRTVTILGGNITSGGIGGTIATSLEFKGNVTFTTSIGYYAGTVTYTSGTINTGSYDFIIVGSCTLNTNGMNWNNLTCGMPTGSDVTVTLSSALQVAGNLLVDVKGILACSTNTVTLNGNWTNNRGTTGRTGNNTFILTSGSHTLNGDTNFYNLTCNAGADITFDADDTFTVTNNFNATGTVGSHVTMDTDDGNAVDFDVTGTVQTVTYVDATDIDSAGGYLITTTGGSITNTVNWGVYTPIPGRR
jgi:hypothetical protein